jgi:hypothetical protein
MRINNIHSKNISYFHLVAHCGHECLFFSTYGNYFMRIFHEKTFSQAEKNWQPVCICTLELFTIQHYHE